MLIVFQHPQGHGPLGFGEVGGLLPFCVFGAEHLRVLEAAVLGGIDHDVPVEQADQVLGGDPQQLTAVLALLEGLVEVEEQFGAEGGQGRLLGVLFQLHRQGAGEEARQEHDDEGDGVAHTVGVEGEAGVGEEEVEDQDAGQG